MPSSRDVELRLELPARSLTQVRRSLLGPKAGAGPKTPARGSSGRVVGAPAAAVLADLLSDWQPLRSAAAAVVISPSRANVIGHRRPARPVWLFAFLDMVNPFPSILFEQLLTKRAH